MIEYDKNRLSDFEYVKELLEDKYIKLENNKRFSIKYIKKITDLWCKYDYYVIAIDGCTIYKNNSFISIKRDQYIEEISLNHKFFKNFYFTTKEDFITSSDILLEEIKKGIEE